MEQSLFRFIWRYSRMQQMWLLLVTALSMPFVWIALDLPKTIINQAIDGEGFPKPVSIGVGGVGVAFESTQIGYLLVLSFLFLGVVLINGGFKYYLNVYRGRMGERMLRRLRYILYSRVLRFPLPHFKKVSAGEIIPMVTAEVEPVGGFIGEAFAVPAFNGGQLLLIAVFMFVQDPLLGAAAVMLYPFQLWLIPKLQRKVNELNKRRVREVRRLSEHVGESVAGATEIHAHDTSRFELAKLADRLGRIYEIRYEVYVRKFFIKFLNNFLAQLTPFFFYALGGYLVIKGDLSFGGLVAALAAYKDLAPHWKELLNWYQRREDIRVKYEQVVEQFQPAGMLDEEMQRTDPPGDADPLAGDLLVANLVLEDESGTRLLDGISLLTKARARLAIVGAPGSGKSELAQLLARLLSPTSGSVTLSGIELDRAPETLVGRRLAFVGEGAYLFSGSIRDALLYGVKHRPVGPAREDGADDDPKAERKRAEEAKLSGNTLDALEADWVDRAAMGVEQDASVVSSLLEVVDRVGLAEDVYALGLRGALDPDERPEIAEAVLQARRVMRKRLSETAQSGLVETFDPERFNTNASVLENVLFGLPSPAAPDFTRPHAVAPLMQALKDTDLSQRFLETGLSVAETMVELFADLPPDHAFWEQFSFISPEDLPAFQALLSRTNRQSLDLIPDADRDRLIDLPFQLVVSRHRLGLIDESFQDALLAARRRFREIVPDALRDQIAFFEVDSYNAVASLQDNILFGRIAYGEAQADQQVTALIGDVLDRLSLRQVVSKAGLDHQIGVGGSRLTGAQRQKVAIGRAILRRPDLLVLDAATSVLDLPSHAAIREALLEIFQDRGLIWAVHRAADAEPFDQVLVMQGGRVVEKGSFAELTENDGSVLSALLREEAA